MKILSRDFLSQIPIRQSYFSPRTAWSISLNATNCLKPRRNLGKAMVNILPIEPEETINTVMPMPEDESSWGALNVLFATASGNIRRNNLSDFTNIKRNGKIAMKLQDGDDLVGVMLRNETDDVLLATRNGKAIRFGVDAVRVFRGRDSTGVRGIRLMGNDRVVSMSVITDDANQFILSVTENGYGKRTPVDDYRRSGRGGQGVANIETSKRNGKVMASFAVVDDDQLMLVTNMGQVIAYVCTAVRGTYLDCQPENPGCAIV